MVGATRSEARSGLHDQVALKNSESPDARCAAMARDQHGLITREQALGCGLGEDQIRWRLQKGLWMREHDCVYRLAGVPTSWRQRLLGACLAGGPGSAASHRAAGQLWQLDAVAAGVVEITSKRRIERPPLIVHRSSLASWETTTKHGIPVTDAYRTLLDLAAVIKPSELERAFESGLRQQLITIPLMAERLERRARSGRTGVRAWRALLEKRDPSLQSTETDFETLMNQLISRFGLPQPQRQLVIRDREGRFIHRADFAYPEARLVVEADSVSYHLSPLEIRRDRRQTRQMMDEGWTVLRVTNWEMNNEAGAVAASIHGLLRKLSGI